MKKNSKSSTFTSVLTAFTNKNIVYKDVSIKLFRKEVTSHNEEVYF